MQATATFPGEARSVSAARRFVVGALADWRLDHLSSTAALLTSELVTNALLHTGGEMTVAVGTEPDGLRVEVTDPSAALPRRRRYGLEATTGRGLGLVEQLSLDWGTDIRGAGKAVWFVLPLSEREDDAAWAAFDADSVGVL